MFVETCSLKKSAAPRTSGMWTSMATPSSSWWAGLDDALQPREADPRRVRGSRLLSPQARARCSCARGGVADHWAALEMIMSQIVRRMSSRIDKGILAYRSLSRTYIARNPLADAAGLARL